MHMILLSKPKGIVSQDEYFLKVLKLKLVLLYLRLWFSKLACLFVEKIKNKSLYLCLLEIRLVTLFRKIVPAFR